MEQVAIPRRKLVPKVNLERKSDESLLEYHKRLVYGKLVDKTLADVDYTELAELAYGQPYASDVARRMFYGSRNTLQLMDAEHTDSASATSESVMQELDSKLLELRKERQKFFDYRNAFNKVVRERSRQEELNEILVNAIANSNLPQLEYEPVDIAPSSNDLLVSLNDIHFGAAHDNYWNVYNSDVCREMMSRYLSKIIQIGKTHQSENCIIWENGDAISGEIHRSIQVTNKENVIEQIIGVSEMIAEFIAELSKHFKTVKFVSVAGNHSRIEPNKENALTGERLDDLIEWWLKARLQNFQNVKIGAGVKIDPTMYLINIRGLNYLGVHGDFDTGTSKVQSLQAMIDRPLYAVLSGHLHHNKVDSVQGIKTIMAGSFLGVDQYCVEKRIYGRAEQMVCVCDNSGVICYYDIPLR